MSLRKSFLNRYAISRVLKNKAIKISSSTVYNIFRRNVSNKLERVKSEPPNFNKSKKIIMSKRGELLHINLHHLASSITICNNNQPYYWQCLFYVTFIFFVIKKYRNEKHNKIFFDNLIFYLQASSPCRKSRTMLLRN